MNRGGGKHETKSMADRDYYNRLIKQQDFEPTKAESLDFSESNDTKEDFSIQKSPKVRRRSIPELIGVHLKENLAGYLISGSVIILFYLMVDSRIDMATIKEKLIGVDSKANRIEQDVKSIENKVESNKDELHKQEMQLRENSIRIENLREREAATIKQKE